MEVNYLTEITCLDDWEMGHPLSATAYKLICKLYMYANRLRFPEKFTVTNRALCLYVGCSENALINARQQLIQKGLIEYQGKKKHTPVYKIHYFTFNPRYNRKYCGIDGGIEGGIDEGIAGGIGMGIAGGCIQTRETNEYTYGDEEDINNNISIPAEARTLGYTPLLHPSPTQGFVDLYRRVREADTAPAFPPRQRDLTQEEMQVLAHIEVLLNVPQCQDLYSGARSQLLQLLRSDRYPLELVYHALQKTLERNGRYERPLSNPMAYTLTLLEDWDKQGFSTVRDVNEAKDNYCDSY